MRALIALLAVSAACNGSALPPGARVSGPTPPSTTVAAVQDSLTISLRTGASADVASTGVRLTFERVAGDSRCPRGVTCVWEGDAVAVLRAEAAGAGGVVLQLHTNAQFARHGEAHGLVIRLQELAPYPDADRPIDPASYVATIAVTRR